MSQGQKKTVEKVKMTALKRYQAKKNGAGGLPKC